MAPWQIVNKDDEGEGYATREEAIAQAMSELSPGDTVDVHEDDCAVKWERPCNCAMQVLVVPTPGRA